MDDLQNAERDARNRYFNNSVFPIVNQDSGEIGSGFFFQRGKHHYVLSAAHVLDDCAAKPSATYLMPATPPSNQPVDMEPLGSSHFMRIQSKSRPIGDDDYLEDVAVHRIEPSAAERFKASGWVFAADCDFFDDNFSECIVFGWPCSLMTPERAGAKNLAGEPVIIQMDAIPKPSASGNKLAGEFFMNCPRNAPELSGISGSPVWTPVSQTTGIWHPSKTLKLVGVQHAVGPDRAYIRCYTLEDCSSSGGRTGKRFRCRVALRRAEPRATRR